MSIFRSRSSYRDASLYLRQSHSTPPPPSRKIHLNLDELRAEIIKLKHESGEVRKEGAEIINASCKLEEAKELGIAAFMKENAQQAMTENLQDSHQANKSKPIEADTFGIEAPTMKDNTQQDLAKELIDPLQANRCKSTGEIEEPSIFPKGNFPLSAFQSKCEASLKSPSSQFCPTLKKDHRKLPSPSKHTLKSHYPVHPFYPDKVLTTNDNSHPSVQGKLLPPLTWSKSDVPTQDTPCINLEKPPSSFETDPDLVPNNLDNLEGDFPPLKGMVQPNNGAHPSFSDCNSSCPVQGHYTGNELPPQFPLCNNPTSPPNHFEKASDLAPTKFDELDINYPPLDQTTSSKTNLHDPHVLAEQSQPSHYPKTPWSQLFNFN